MNIYINRDELVDRINKHVELTNPEEQESVKDECIRQAHCMPHADVVEVVRCKDCVKRYTPDCAMQYRCQICGGQWQWENNNDFCSYGERRGA